MTNRLFKANSIVIQKAIENELSNGFISIRQIAENLELSRQCVSKYVNRMYELDLIEDAKAEYFIKNGKKIREYTGYKYRLK